MMMRLIKAILILAVPVPAHLQAGAPDKMPLLHPLFASHSVLQRECPVPIWGWAEPGTTVTVRFADQSKKAKAGADRRWTCTLDPLAASAESRTLTVETDKPDLRAEAGDVLVGDVWLCSGQSNMEMGITVCNEDEEIAKADHPNLRLLTIPHHIAYKPQPSFQGNWKRCTPETIRQNGWGGFSAAAYFFGKKLQDDLGIPIGLIHSSWGGTPIESWTSGPALKPIKAFDTPLEQVGAIANSTAADPLKQAMNAWFTKHDIGTTGQWQQEKNNTSNWRKVSLPANWGDCGLPGFEGIVWVQRRIELPAGWTDQPLVIQLGRISDTDTTWLNGREIGRTDSYETARSYNVPAGIAKSGLNVLTLRVTNAGGGGVNDKETAMRIHPVGREQEAIALDGSWLLQETAELKDTGRPLVGNPQVPSVLYNGMIAPLVPTALKGVIWYQGEANASRARQYRTLLPTLIGDWRKRIQRGDLAFHIVSLANFQPASDKPRDHPWAELREAQAMTAKTLPHCGLAVAIDIGDANDIHPKNKREVGRRLALNALATTYGKPVAGSGPSFRSMKVEDGSLRLHFDPIHGGLRLKGPSDRSFAIAGKDRKFVWASAVIEGATLRVSSPEVTKPVAVRYAWDANPQACLYNDADLPAVPFRSDDWPATSEPP